MEEKYNKMRARLAKFAVLNNNWDGYGGVCPPEEIITTAGNFINKIELANIPCPRIMVAGSGEVGMYWESKEKKIYVEVDFDTKDEYSYFYKMDNEPYGADDLLVDDLLPTELTEAIKKIY